jgi:hypothetical protein
VILVDANILMYAAGVEHLCKRPSVGLLASIAEGDTEAAIDTEVLQEVLHRYRAIGRWSDGRRVYDAARRIFTVVLPITAEVTDRARLLLDRHPELSARDALHAAVVQIRDLEAICSYDRDFDMISDIRRIEPA